MEQEGRDSRKGQDESKKERLKGTKEQRAEKRGERERKLKGRDLFSLNTGKATFELSHTSLRRNRNRRDRNQMSVFIAPLSCVRAKSQCCVGVGGHS